MAPFLFFKKLALLGKRLYVYNMKNIITIAAILTVFVSCTKTNELPASIAANNNANRTVSGTVSADSTQSADTTGQYTGMALAIGQCSPDTTEVEVYASIARVDSNGDFHLTMSAPALSPSTTQCVGSVPVYTHVGFAIYVFDSKGGQFRFTGVGPISNTPGDYMFQKITPGSTIVKILIQHNGGDYPN